MDLLLGGLPLRSRITVGINGGSARSISRLTVRAEAKEILFDEDCRSALQAGIDTLWVLEVWELILLFLQLLWILYYCSPAHIEFHGIAVLSSALFDIRYHCREVFAVLICVLSFCCPPWSQTAQLNWKVQSGRIYLSGKCSIPVCLWDLFLFLYLELFVIL